MRRQHLEYQADQIEMVLATHNTPGRVMGGVVTPRWIKYNVLPSWGAKVSKITSLGEEIALRLGSDGVRVRRNGGTVQIEIPREDGQTVRLLSLCRRLANVPPQSCVLGIDEDGTPILLRLPSPEVVHVLVAGTTGSGKTALARSMAVSLAIHNRLGEAQMLFIDPKGSGFGPLGSLPHLLRPVVGDCEEAVVLLGEMVEEMEKRDAEEVTEPRIVIFIDELADLIQVGGKEVEMLLTRILQRGRGAGLHVIACTQKPTASAIGSLVKGNFPIRLVGSVNSPEEAKIATGLAGSGAEKLLGRGDFLLVGKGRTTRFQSAYVCRSEIEELSEKLNGGGRRSRRWLAPGQLEATGTYGGNGHNTSRLQQAILRGAKRLQLVK